MYEDYYPDLAENRILKHSGFGIASFTIALAIGALEFILLVVAGILETTTPGGIDENSPIAMLLGLVMIGGILVGLLGIIFGIVGLCQQGRKKVFAVLGVVIGSLVLVGFLLVMIVGLTMD